MADITIFYCRGEKQDSTALLQKAASRYTGQSGPFAVEKEPHGKPFFPDHPDLYFSVTHSGGFWMAAFSPQKVGLDLQEKRVTGREKKLSERFFAPLERDWLKGQPDERFFDLWAAKESFVKYSGLGFSAGRFPDFAVADGTGLLPTVKGLQLRHLRFDPGFSLCLCAEAIDSVRFEKM